MNETRDGGDLQPRKTIFARSLSQIWFCFHLLLNPPLTDFGQEFTYQLICSDLSIVIQLYLCHSSVAAHTKRGDTHSLSNHPRIIVGGEGHINWFNRSRLDYFVPRFFFMYVVYIYLFHVCPFVFCCGYLVCWITRYNYTIHNTHGTHSAANYDRLQCKSASTLTRIAVVEYVLFAHIPWRWAAVVQRGSTVPTASEGVRMSECEMGIHSFAGLVLRLTWLAGWLTRLFITMSHILHSIHNNKGGLCLNALAANLCGFTGMIQVDKNLLPTGEYWMEMYRECTILPKERRNVLKNTDCNQSPSQNTLQP